MYLQLFASIFALLTIFLPITVSVPTPSPPSPSHDLTPRSDPFSQGTHHMQCYIPTSDSECYQRYHHLCNLRGLPSYGLPKIKCERDGCWCVANHEELGVIERDLQSLDTAADSEEEDFNDLKDRKESEGRRHGSMWCPMPDEESECWVRFHGLCEQRGFLPGGSVADIVCGWDKCLCSHV